MVFYRFFGIVTNNKLKKGNPSIVAQLLLALSIFSLGVRASESAVEAKEPPSLEVLLRNAVSRNGEIKESEQDVEIANQQVELAKSASYPTGQLLLLGSPMFQIKGTPLRSESDLTKWGALVHGYLQLAQPIYSFGMITNYRKAADHQVIAKSEMADMRRADVIYRTKELYYTYRMASNLEGLVDDLVKYLEQAVSAAENSLKPGKKSSVKPHDVYHLKTALEDLKQKQLYAKQGRQTAEKAVGWMSVTSFDSLSTDSLEPEEYEKKPLEEYVRLAHARRPEFRALKAGQEARAALRDAKRAQSYPIVFVGGFGGGGYTQMTQVQPSIFAQDPFNQFTGGFGVGLKFDFEYKKHAAEAGEQEAELMKLKATESYAAPGIELEVKKAFWELEQAAEGLEVAERRKKIAKKWFVSNAMGWSIGITPAKDLLESLQGHGEAKQNYIQTVFSLNLALARLSKAVGQEVTNLTYK